MDRPSTAHTRCARATRLRLTLGQRRFLAAVVFALVALRLLMIVDVPLADTTEARYGEMARKMLETGDWIMPQHDYGVPFWGKPPLHTWLSAAGMALFGIHEFGSRVLILLTSLGALALVHAWVRRTRGADIAILSTAILASSGLFFVCSGVVCADPMLMVGTTISAVAFWNALDEPRRGVRIWGHLFFVGLAWGMLAKGPVAVALTVLAVGGWALWRRRLRDTVRALPWPSGTALLLALAAPWFVIAELHSPGFLRYFVWGEHVLRFVDSGWDGDLYGNSHSEPLGTIVTFALLGFLPWSVLPAWALLRSRRVRRWARTGGGGAESDWTRYLACHALAPIVLFAPCRNVLPTYVLTGMPALAILVAELLATLRLRPRPAWRAARLSFAGIFALYVGGYVVTGHTVELNPRKTHKWIVHACERYLPVTQRGELFVWDHRYYSAEFYSRGDAEVVDDVAELRGVLANGRRDFLSVRKEYVKTIPVALMSRFVRIGRFRKDDLFVETMRPATDSRPR